MNRKSADRCSLLELAKKHLKMTLRAVIEDEAASQEDGVAPIVDIAAFMKEPFTEIDFLDDEQVNYHTIYSVLYMF